MKNINNRLDKIKEKMKEEKFIKGHGLGNEISFYIFDYDPKHELVVRDEIQSLHKKFSHEMYNRKVIEFDLYKMLLDMAREKNIFDTIFEMERNAGHDHLFKSLLAFAKPEIFLEKMEQQIEDHNVIFITGVGKVYPFVRSHTILNNLQEKVENIPVIMFYPGQYDGQSLRLFGKFKDDNYYRAFPLVDRKGGYQ